MSTIAFAKYHGLGNDFVVVDLRQGDPAGVQRPEVVRALCDRHFGIGADGVLPILPSSAADCRMRVLNADGSEAEMCGNGIRCIAKHLVDRDPGFAGREQIIVETLAGALACGLRRRGSAVTEVSVQMGRPRFARAEIPMLGPAGERFVDQPVDGAGGRATAVSMGNPHLIFFVDETGAALRARAEAVGPGLERHPWFPRRTNVEIARAAPDGSLEVVVWERGVGITLACGTGACATAVAACLTGRAQRGSELRVRLLGGELAITVAPDDSGVTMRGPATLVFESTIDPDRLL